MAQHEPLFNPRELVAALDDQLQERDFDPAPSWLEALGPDDSPSPYATAGRWLRTRPSDDQQGREHGDWEPTSRHGGGDFVDVFLTGSITLDIAGTHARFEWRSTSASAENFAAAVLAYLDQLDLGAPPR